MLFQSIRGCIPGVGRAHSAAGLPPVKAQRPSEPGGGRWGGVGWGALRLNTLTDSRGRVSYVGASI